MKGRVWPWLLLILAFVPAFFITRPKPHVSPATVQNVTLAIFTNPSTLDPALARSDSETLAATNVFQGLFRLNVGGRPVGVLASSYHIAGKTLAIDLRASKHLADGTPVTSDMVAGALSRSLWPSVGSSTARALMAQVVGYSAVVSGHRLYLSGVRVTGPLSLSITLTKPVTTTFLDALASPSLAMVPTQDMARGGANWQWTNLIGSGGFKLTDWEPNGKLAFAKVHGTGPSHIDLVRYPSWHEALLSYINGELTGLPVSFTQLGQVSHQQQHSLRALREPGVVSLYYRTGAHGLSSYPKVSPTAWVRRSFHGMVSLSDVASWPSGLPTGKPMTVYVNAANAEAVMVAKTLKADRTGLVTIQEVSASQLQKLASGNKIGAYVGVADWFKTAQKMTLAPMTRFWLLNGALSGASVYANGALDWHSLAPHP